MDILSEIPSAFSLVREQLIREFPREKVIGLDTKRAERFIEEKGLPVKPYVIFDSNDYDKVEKIVGNTNLLRNAFQNGVNGIYSPEMDLILVRRDEKLEKMNGGIYTEGLLVHELAHASSMYQGYITSNKQRFYTPRVGFCLPQNNTPWGWLLEEGWADMHGAEYFSKFATEEQKRRIEDIMKFGPLNWEDTIPIVTPKGNILPLPVKYIYINEKGGPTIKSSAYAGYTIELLCRIDPTLYSILKQARSSVEGLRKLAIQIDRISPSLYFLLQTSDYSENDFSTRLQEVISRVYGDVRNLIKGSDTLKTKWNNLLQSKNKD